MKKKLLWLDDFRDPNAFIGKGKELQPITWLEKYNPLDRKCILQVFWVKNYNEFVLWIERNGLPDAICFDHDLGEEHIKYYFENGGHANPPDPSKANFKEKTGFDCAKWLIEYCIDKKLKLPVYNIQSANSVGKENINGLLLSFNKFNAE